MSIITKTILGHEITFCEESHTYKVDGVPTPSVTTILKSAGLSPDYSKTPKRVLENKRDIGKEVHHTCHAINQAVMELGGYKGNESYVMAYTVTFYEDIRDWGYTEAYCKFLRESGFVPTHAEEIVYHPSYKYIGTFDTVGLMNTDRVLIDIKTPTMDHPSYAIQTAAYQSAFEWCYKLPVHKRFSLLLKPDGNYDPCPHEDPMDFNVFVAGLIIHRFKEAKGYGE